MMCYSAAQGESEPWQALHSSGNENQQLGVLWSSGELPSGFCSGALSTQQQHTHIPNTSGNAFLHINTSFHKYPQEKAPAVTAQHSHQLNNPRFPSEALRQSDCYQPSGADPTDLGGYSLTSFPGSLSPRPAPAPSTPCTALGHHTPGQSAKEGAHGSEAARKERTWGTNAQGCLSEQWISLSYHMTCCSCSGTHDSM